MELSELRKRVTAGGLDETALALLSVIDQHEVLKAGYEKLMAEYARYRDDAQRINIRRQYLAAALAEAFESTHRTEHVVFDDTPFVGEINGWFDMRIIAEAVLANPRVTEQE